MAQEKFAVRLSEEDGGQLERLIRSGQHSARVINRARILLKTDEGWSASQVASALDTLHGRMRLLTTERHAAMQSGSMSEPIGPLKGTGRRSLPRPRATR